MLSGSGYGTGPMQTYWFCHLCRWTGILTTGQVHRCSEPETERDAA